MTERPILFSAPMVRALLAGTKTQTRRVVKGLPPRTLEFDREWSAQVLAPAGSLPDQWSWWDGPPHGQSICHLARCPYGVAGDVLWVKETWQAQAAFDHLSPSALGDLSAEEHGEPSCPIRYVADGKCNDWSVEQWQESEVGKTRVSIHMPRWASRISLRITDVRVERLNEISEADAMAEGVGEHVVEELITAKGAYSVLWDEINGPGSWDANPWVWCVSFESIT